MNWQSLEGQRRKKSGPGIDIGDKCRVLNGGVKHSQRPAEGKSGEGTGGQLGDVGIVAKGTG